MFLNASIMHVCLCRQLKIQVCSYQLTIGLLSMHTSRATCAGKQLGRYSSPDHPNEVALRDCQHC